MKGVFGVPLELLVEREGSDSLLGATRETMRVPSFIDDVISAMRQMGKLELSIFHGLCSRSFTRHVCRGNLQKEWKHSPAQTIN